MNAFPKFRLLAGFLAGLGAAALLGGCAVLAPLPEPSTTDQRLAQFPVDLLPLERPVTVHWEDHQIPFIEAETDADLAFALGLVQAHLRLGQMELVRRIAAGRLSEMAGPSTLDIDRSLRILDLDRAVPEILAAMPAESRRWLDRFVAGVNHYVAHAAAQDALPHDFTVLGLAPEPWTAADVIGIARLAAIDTNWFVWFRAMTLRQHEDWPRIWARFVSRGTASIASFEASSGSLDFATLLQGFAKTGSNSFAVAGERSVTGGAMLANDPHLGILLPNVWLIGGYKSPSYHAVGLMVPGIPAIGLGRNPWLAWGGTNMRAASSDLVDLSAIEAEDIRSRRETIGVRWWFDDTVEIRETPYGPVLSDAPSLPQTGGPPFALRWTGHAASDELTALLRASQAKDGTELRAAFETFAVGGQNILYADAAGNVGQFLAVHLPKRPKGWHPEAFVTRPEESDANWRGRYTTADLPFVENPPGGLLASSNNRPVETDIPLGFFFAGEDRVTRIAERLALGDPLSPFDLFAIQRDVYQASSKALADTLAGHLRRPGTVGEPEAAAVVAALRDWDGHYRAEARGPVAFELVYNAFLHRFYAGRFGEEALVSYLAHPDSKRLVLEDIREADADDATAVVLRTALAQAVADAAEAFADFPDWGSMHRLRLAHPLGNAPLIGARYRFFDLPVSGTSDTVMKTAHPITDERHSTRYGANARHVSDMSDMDRNWFVLLGGQDGWFNSRNFADQVPMWQSGSYVQVPLRLDTVRQRFSRKLRLTPEPQGASR